LIESFEFADDDRTYRCQVRPAAGNGSEKWWWFQTSGDQQWYAPFRAASNDTKKNVGARVLSFYKNRLARLAEPPVSRYRRGRPSNAELEQRKAAEAQAD
jgi:hypothetical protein